MEDFAKIGGGRGVRPQRETIPADRPSVTHPRLPAAILRSLVADDRGQDIIEYALLFSLIALAAIAPIQTASSGIARVFSSVGSTLTSAV
jgi:pilus assembly protein Flp/PilA